MDKVNIKSLNSVTNKKLGIKKKQNGMKTNNSKTENWQSKTLLKRGKLPSNWNSYVETKNSTETSRKVVQKFPKNLTTNNTKNEGNMTRHSTELSTGRCIGIDCEMVGINDGGRDHMLARVSLVDENGSVVYDTFVKPTQRVVDYRTAVSGVRPADLTNGREFNMVQAEVHNILQNKVLVGHAVRNDLSVLFLHHNKKYIRDTSKFKKFRDEANGMTPSLKFLAKRFLDMDIQSGEHSSIEDARAAMLLYMKFRNTWESELRTSKYKR